MPETIKPVSFLHNLGIDLKATSLIIYKDGKMNQTSLTALMDGYHMAKIYEESLRQSENIKP